MSAPGQDSGQHHLRLQDALAQLPTDSGERFALLLTHGTLEVEIYAPRGTDEQTPHTRDEVYVVMCGSGRFVNGSETHDFGPGDLLFVPAGVEHRFVDFSEDLAVWVVFYGPEGGEENHLP